VVLLNGLLIDQAECWHRNLRYWQRFFIVHTPDLLVYDGPRMQQRVSRGLPISVDYLVEELHRYLQTTLRTPAHALVASSLGAKIAVEYAVRYQGRVTRLVLLGPSGLGDEERLPVVEGVRRGNVRHILQSIFHDHDTLRSADPQALASYECRFASRPWRTGLLRTIRGTRGHCVRDQLARVAQPTLVVSGREDCIVCPIQAEEAAQLLPRGWFLSVPQCGHAPHVEKPELINPLVRDFLSSPEPERFLLPPLLSVGR
jgi:pimeloyl-ACP methyl ester carboxylesterase